MTPPVLLEVQPETAYLEPTPAGHSLNVDLVFSNQDDQPWRLTSLAIDAYDEEGRIVLRRALDEHGLSPGIEVIPDRVVPAHGSLLIFNPLNTFGVQPSRVGYTCALDADGRHETVRAELLPRLYQQHVSLVLPVTGRVLVAAGHDFLSPHRRIDLSHPLAKQVGLKANSGRFAEDFSIVDEEGRLFEGDGASVDGWFGFGAPVRAPGAGRVVAAVADVADNRFGRAGVEFASQPPDPAAAIFGNHLVLDHGSGEFSVLAHLQRESVRVQAGDEVERGQQVGRMGFSGNTDFVHLHYQLQNGPDAREAEGLPARFGDAGWPLEPGTILLSG